MQKNRLLTPILALTVALGLVVPDRILAATLDRATILLSTSYTLKANLNYATGTIAARETIVARNVASYSISKVNLQVFPRAFNELTAIGNFTVDGRAVSARWTNNANLELQLGRVLEPQQSATIRLTFAVRAGGVIGTSLEGRLSKANGIMQVASWYPVVSDGHPVRYPGDASYTRRAQKVRLELTTDSSSVRVAAPGRAILVSGRSHVYEMENTRDFAFAASPSFRTISGSSAGVGVIAYYTTGNGSAALTYARSALVTYESAFGQYQWPRFVIAQSGRPSSGNEYPGIIFLGATLFSNREVVAHEVAHQWWYAMAGNDQLNEPWLDEGLAEFSANYFYGSFHSYVSDRPVNASIYEFPNLPAPVTSNDPHSYDQTVYYKSAAFLNGLRVRMGNTRFFSALRDLFAANRNTVITTREFYDTFARYGASTTYMRQFIRI